MRKIRSDLCPRQGSARGAAQDPAGANIVSAVRPFEDPAPPGMHDFDLVTFFFGYHDVINLGTIAPR